MQTVGGHQHSQNDVLEGVLDTVEDGLDRNEARVSVGDVVQSLNDRGFGALCAVIGAVAATPVIGGLPGVSVLTALLVLLIAGQHALGRHSLWIPSIFAERSIDRQTFENGVEKARRYVGWVDGLVRPRLNWIVGGRAERRLIALAMFILALSMLPLALIPWGVLVPALAITAFGLAITVRDGLFAIVGYALLALTAYVLYAFSEAILSLL